MPIYNFRVIKKPKHPHHLAERIHERNRRAEAYLQDKDPVKKSWGRMFLWVGDLADGIYSITGNEYTSALVGGAIGLARGLVIGALVAVGALIICPTLIHFPAALLMGQAAYSLTGGAFITTGAVMIGAMFAINDAVKFYREASLDSVEAKAAKIGDKIAETGDALPHEGKAPAQGKQTAPTIPEIDDKKPYKEPKGANHEYAEALRRSKALEQRERSL